MINIFGIISMIFFCQLQYSHIWWSFKQSCAVSFHSSKQYKCVISSHNHSTPNRIHLAVLFQMLSLTQHFVSQMGTTVWNCLRSAASFSIFETRVKKLDRYVVFTRDCMTVRVHYFGFWIYSFWFNAMFNFR